MNALNPPALAIRQLHLVYGRRVICPALDIGALGGGQVVGLLGANGVGKSTLLRSLARLQPSRGDVRWGDLDLLRCPPHALLRVQAYLPQNLPQGSSLLVYEALRSTLKATRSDLDAQASQSQIDTVLDRLQLAPLALKRLDQLSGGQRQMVGLAQVLVRQTPLVLLDEPTSALDLRWQLLALQTLREDSLRHGTLALVALHDLNLAARFCDHLLLLGPAGLLAQGSASQVLQPAHLAQAYRVSARIETTALHETLVLADRALG